MPIETSEEVESYLALWSAVLALMIDDAIDYVRLGPGKTNDRMTAHDDLMRCGVMTRRLARFCCVDPKYVTMLFRIRLGQVQGATPSIAPAGDAEQHQHLYNSGSPAWWRRSFAFTF